MSNGDSFDFYSKGGEYERKKDMPWCPWCRTRNFKYHEWDAIDRATGDHLGKYRIWECEDCGATYNPNTNTFTKGKA